MIDLLQETLPELKKVAKSRKKVSKQAAEILKHFLNKDPDKILHAINFNKYYHFYQYWRDRKKTELKKVINEGVETEKSINLFILLHILNSRKEKSDLNWIKPQFPIIKTENRYLNQDLNFIKHLNNLKPTHQPEKLISKWIQGRRVMPSSSPFPGIYDIHKTPYIIELCDNMSPYTDVDYQSVKKGVQIAITTAAENCIAYYWKERPADQMYLTGTEDLIKKFNTKRLGPLMESAGLEADVQIYKKKSRKSGDTIEIKEYYGGNLTMGSIQSSAHTRSDSIRIMYIDEIDEAGAQMSSGDGHVVDVLDGRLTAFEGRSKMFSLSTPKTFGDSSIDIQYERGDKRKFNVKCPFCGKLQWLTMGDTKSSYGLKGDFKRGRLINAYYLCYFCGDAWFEGHKEELLKSGIWLPEKTEIAPEKGNRSYHLPSFYSPMMSWKKMFKKYLQAESEGDEGMKSFTNLYLGLSFEPSGERPDLKSVIEIRSKYKSGTVPNGILYLTMATDVQRGKDKWKNYTNQQIWEIADELTKKKQFKKLDALRLPRLEVEVIGHGRDFRTASIIYKKFHGKLSDYTGGAWKKFTEWRNINPEGLFFTRDDGFKFPIQMIFVDSGWAPTEDVTDVVYNYCHSWDRMYPIKGTGTYKQDKQKLNDITAASRSDIMRFKLSKTGEHPIVLIHGNYYKRMIYRNFKNESSRINDQQANTHITPSDYPDSYFEALRAEKQKTNGDFWNPARKPNEALDLLVYNKAAGDFFIQDLIIRLQERLKIKYPQLKNTRSMEVREKLNEIANREIVTDNLEAELSGHGW